jgi:hypothetical protein
VCAGALIFALSDSTIATEKFIVGARVPGATVRAHHAVFAALVALVVPACLSAVVAVAALALAVAVVLAAAVAAVVAVTGSWCMLPSCFALCVTTTAPRSASAWHDAHMQTQAFIMFTYYLAQYLLVSGYSDEADDVEYKAPKGRNRYEE